jgi:hypothetical protein
VSAMPVELPECVIEMGHSSMSGPPWEMGSGHRIGGISSDKRPLTLAHLHPGWIDWDSKLRLPAVRGQWRSVSW